MRHVSYLVIATLLLVVCAVRAEDKPAHLAVQSVNGQEGTGWHANLWKSRFPKMLERAKQGDVDIVFLGDSITHFWETKGKASYDKFFANRKVLNTAVAGDRTQHVLWILKDSTILDPITPKLFVLMIGTNNVGWNETNPAQTLEGIQAILATIREKEPQAKVLVFDVFPRGANEQDGLRKQVDEINRGIPALCDGVHAIHCSINKQLLESDGKTLSREMMGDLLHPEAEGYEIWSAAILPFADKFCGKPQE